MESIFPVLAEHGTIGAFAVAFGLLFWKERERSAKISEERIEELRESLTALQENTNALNTLTEVIKAGRR